MALKKLKMEKEKEGFPITSLREINTLLKSHHPNIINVRVSSIVLNCSWTALSASIGYCLLGVVLTWYIRWFVSHHDSTVLYKLVTVLLESISIVATDSTCMHK